MKGDLVYEGWWIVVFDIELEGEELEVVMVVELVEFEFVVVLLQEIFVGLIGGCYFLVFFYFVFQVLKFGFMVEEKEWVWIDVIVWVWDEIGVDWLSCVEVFRVLGVDFFMVICWFSDDFWVG